MYAGEYIFNYSCEDITSTPALAALLPNGGFDIPPKPSHLNKTVILGRLALPNWEIYGLVEYIAGGSQSGGMCFPVSHGVHAVSLGNEATISQLIRVKQGSLYAFTFSSSKTCAQDEVLMVSVPPQSGNLPLQTLKNGYGGDSLCLGLQSFFNCWESDISQFWDSRGPCMWTSE